MSTKLQIYWQLLSIIDQKSILNHLKERKETTFPQFNQHWNDLSFDEKMLFLETPNTSVDDSHNDDSDNDNSDNDDSDDDYEGDWDIDYWKKIGNPHEDEDDIRIINNEKWRLEERRHEIEFEIYTCESTHPDDLKAYHQLKKDEKIYQKILSWPRYQTILKREEEEEQQQIDIQKIYIIKADWNGDSGKRQRRYYEGGPEDWNYAFNFDHYMEGHYPELYDTYLKNKTYFDNHK